MGYLHEYLYWAVVMRWVDGDTVDVLLDLGFNTHRKERLRLVGVNTPELRPKHDDFPTPEERNAHIEKAKEALALCEKLAPAGFKVLVRTYKDEKGKYGRYLASVIHDPNNLQNSVNLELLDAGLAVPADYS